LKNDVNVGYLQKVISKINFFVYVLKVTDENSSQRFGSADPDPYTTSWFRNTEKNHEKVDDQQSTQKTNKRMFRYLTISARWQRKKYAFVNITIF